MTTDKQLKGLRILFADDEPSLQNVMRIELPRRGHEVTVCPDGLTAIAALEKNSYDCLLVDLDMPGRNGLEVITYAREQMPEAESVVLTGKSSLESAIGALRQGAFDYLTKPYKMAELERVIGRIAERRALQNRCQVLERELQLVAGTTQLVGHSDGMRRVRDLVARVAAKPATVLIRGETGTGKELVARLLHEQSRHGDKPFVAVNCGALPETLIESELFGHTKGAFTGADQSRRGLFHMAEEGTLFLDEIGELPKNMQAKLLRVLESGEVRRIGEQEAQRIDTRVVCATHRNLEEMVAEGTFREDLLFRINTFEIYVPSLRERMDDIPELAQHLLARYAPTTPGFTKSALDYLDTHTWPGNVRELANAIEHATILCDDGPIDVEHLPNHRGRVASADAIFAKLGPRSLRELESLAIAAALQRSGGNRGKAAEELGISPKTLYNKLQSDSPNSDNEKSDHSQTNRAKSDGSKSAA